jgi:ribosomal protein L19E
MNLKRKKKLIARTLGVGIEKIRLNSEMRDEIKEAITRQDIKDLKKENIIKIKEKRGKLKKKKRKTKRRGGSRKKKLKKRKQDYVKLTRKLRAYIKNLKIKGKISLGEYRDLRKKIRAGVFRDLAHLAGAIKK